MVALVDPAGNKREGATSRSTKGRNDLQVGYAACEAISFDFHLNLAKDEVEVEGRSFPEFLPSSTHLRTRTRPFPLTSTSRAALNLLLHNKTEGKSFIEQGLKRNLHSRPNPSFKISLDNPLSQLAKS